MHDNLSVVVPVFNSERSLPALIARLKPVLEKSATQFEVILVDDGSTDHSANVSQELSRTYPWIRPLSLMRNYGQHNALLCGIRAARYPILVTIDDDLQNPPEEIPNLLSALAGGYDVVYGTANEPHYGGLRGPLTRLVKWALGVAMGMRIASDISAFRAFHTSLRDTFAHFENPYVSIDVLLSWSTTKFGSVAVTHAAREHGESTYSIRKLLAYTVNVLVGFSTLPLRLATVLGLCLSGFGILVLAYVLARYFIQHGSVPGFPFLASIIAIFSGSQLCTLGILGEYVARIYLKAIQQPTYVIKPPADARAPS